jgi:hypothetical protein
MFRKIRNVWRKQKCLGKSEMFVGNRNVCRKKCLGKSEMFGGKNKCLGKSEMFVGNRNT